MRWVFSSKPLEISAMNMIPTQNSLSGSPSVCACGGGENVGFSARTQNPHPVVEESLARDDAGR